MLGNRCMHELKTQDINKAAEKMMTETEGSRTIEALELGRNVLTLTEVM